MQIEYIMMTVFFIFLYSTTIKENADIIQFVFAAINIRAGIYVLDKKNNKKAKKNSYNVIPTKNNIIPKTSPFFTKSFFILFFLPHFTIFIIFVSL